MSLHASDFGLRETTNEHGPATSNLILVSSPSGVAPYTFRIVPTRSLLHITISGFWTSDTLARFTRGLHAAIAALECGSNRHLICCDVSHAAIQPQDIMVGFRNLIVHGPNKARKMALFTTSPLSRMQSRRIVAFRANVAFFETEAAALAWLFDDAQ